MKSGGTSDKCDNESCSRSTIISYSFFKISLKISRGNNVASVEKRRDVHDLVIEKSF